MSGDRRKGPISPAERSEAAREHNPHPKPQGEGHQHRTRPGARDEQTGRTGLASDADRDIQQKPVSPTTTRPGGFSP